MYAMLVCDDADEAAILTLVLQRVGLSVLTTMDAGRALHDGTERPIELIILCLAGDSFIEPVRRIRKETEAPLVIIARQYDEEALYQALDAGADLAVTRPYSARLLIMQLGALLRRSRAATLARLPLLSTAQITLDPTSQMVQVAGREPRRLTHLEFRLLYTLMIHQGQTLPTLAIVERVWGYSDEGSAELVRGLISRLRAKVEENPKQPRHIRTVPGIGYLFE